jgi:cell shape-determining protein MreC
MKNERDDLFMELEELKNRVPSYEQLLERVAYLEAENKFLKDNYDILLQKLKD